MDAGDALVMKKLLPTAGLLILAASCTPQQSPDRPNSQRAETNKRYASLVTSVESGADQEEPADTESVAEQAENTTTVGALDSRPTATDVDRNETAPERAVTDAERRTEAVFGFDFLYFKAGWCPACKRQSPVLEKLKNDGYCVRIVDIDVEPTVARLFGIRSIPAYVAAVDGRIVLGQDGWPKLSQGMSLVRGRRGSSLKVDPQSVLDLLDDAPQAGTVPHPLDTHSTPQLKRIAAGHDCRNAPAYVGFTGNRNRQDYLDHLTDDHGFTVTELAGWTTQELFQLHSAVHCRSCRRQLNRRTLSTR